MKYPIETKNTTIYFEVPDYVIDDFASTAGIGLFGISVEYHSCSEEYSVFGMDQEGGEHDVTDHFDLEDIQKLTEQYYN